MTVLYSSCVCFFDFVGVVIEAVLHPVCGTGRLLGGRDPIRRIASGDEGLRRWMAVGFLRNWPVDSKGSLVRRSATSLAKRGGRRSLHYGG